MDGSAEAELLESRSLMRHTIIQRASDPTKFEEIGALLSRLGAFRGQFFTDTISSDATMIDVKFSSLLQPLEYGLQDLEIAATLFSGLLSLLQVLKSVQVTPNLSLFYYEQLSRQVVILPHLDNVFLDVICANHWHLFRQGKDQRAPELNLEQVLRSEFAETRNFPLLQNRRTLWKVEMPFLAYSSALLMSMYQTFPFDATLQVAKPQTEAMDVDSQGSQMMDEEYEPRPPSSHSSSGGSESSEDSFRMSSSSYKVPQDPDTQPVYSFEGFPEQGRVTGFHAEGLISTNLAFGRGFDLQDGEILILVEEFHCGWFDLIGNVSRLRNLENSR